MSGPFGVMGWNPLISGLLLPLCLQWNPITGVAQHLRCVNNYLLTINCSLSIGPLGNPSKNSSYWLRFKESNEPETFECVLTKSNGEYFCSVKKHNLTPEDDDYYSVTFSTIDIYDISLCYNESNGSGICELLDEEYTPHTNIKPNAPCCLTVSSNSGQHRFSWKGAEEYVFTGLERTLMYQLQYSRRGDNNDVISQDINTESSNYSVGDANFEPDTQYTGRVRSSPNQVTYKGQWSDWSGEVHWRTNSTGKALPPNSFVFGLEVIIALCVITMIFMLLCYTRIKKWRQSTFIPTPALYFDSLYGDCQGDFKSWVITPEKMGGMLTAEERLQIDTVIKCADSQESLPQFNHPLMGSSTYRNLTKPGCDVCGLGDPCSRSVMVSPITPGSPAEGDSGCWLSNHTPQETGPPFYYNEYCTLSAVQTNPAEA